MSTRPNPLHRFALVSVHTSCCCFAVDGDETDNKDHKFNSDVDKKNFFYPNDGSKNNYDGGNVDECDDDGDFDNGSADIDKKWQ